MKQTKMLTIKGLVQGIGYRPFVAREAEKRNISGWVRNTSGIVTVLASGEEAQVGALVNVLKTTTPPGGFIESVEISDVEESDVEESDTQKRVINDNDRKFVISGLADSGFKIIESNEENIKGEYPFIPADIATCDLCEREVFDEGNRRYRHPFISCVSCGPRYSIIEKLPYDRPRIVMKKYEMCPECKSEYTALNDRRRHAQTIACKDCGPVLVGYYLSENQHDNNHNKIEPYDEGSINVGEGQGQYNYAAIEEAVKVIRRGGIVAIKDIGGFHLACDPFSEEAVDKLRKLKGRERKPFAVMFNSIAEIDDYCYVNEKEKGLLLNTARPIVLLNRKKFVLKDFAYNVCDTSPSIGAMLPCNPIQKMLVKSCGPLIMTSANPSGGLLATEGAELTELADNIEMEPSDSECMKGEISSEQEANGGRYLLDKSAVYVLGHDREILVPLEDSIKRVVDNREMTIRRARGYVPMPLKASVKGGILAIGGDLKSVFCFTGNKKAYLSAQFGDLEDEDSFEAFKKEIVRMTELFGFKPKTIVCDMHPGYISTNYAEKLVDELYKGQCTLKKVQHHKAHVASVIAEHDIKEEAICFAFDGTGYGEDGAIWGSEVFLWEDNQLIRINHLDYVSLPASDKASKDTKLSALGYLSVLSEQYQEKILLITQTRAEEFKISKGELALTKAAIKNDINRVQSSSMGRLFDAVSFLLGICAYNNYEGEAPMEMEYCIGDASDWTKSVPLKCNFSANEILEYLIDGLIENKPVNELAAEFHLWLAHSIVNVAGESGKKTVVLSGGTFLNEFLLKKIIELLHEKNIEVYINEQIPPGDGGICLGQAFLARTPMSMTKYLLQ